MNKISEIDLLKTPVFTVVKKEFKETAFQPVGLNCKDWVMVIALTTDNLNEAKGIFVRQTRWGVEARTTEFPCGTVEENDFAGGKDGRKVATIREFKEETGIEINENELISLGWFNPNPAYFSNIMTVYAVVDKDLEKKFNKRGEQNLDANEDCEVFIDWLANKRFFGNAMQMAGYTLLKQKFD